MKIVLLEDHSHTLIFLQEQLAAIYPHAHIYAYAQYKEASSCIHTQSIDLVVTDLDFDGEKEFALVADAYQKQIPCIIYSAHYNTSYLNKASAYAYRAFICKLGGIDELLYALKHYTTLELYQCQFIQNQHSKEEHSIAEPILNGVEQSILKFIIQGKERKEIAEKLKIKSNTLNSYIRDMVVNNNCSLYELIHRYVVWHKE
jgi:DNA-binding NarL/FixJ family response regulator